MVVEVLNLKIYARLTRYIRTKVLFIGVYIPGSAFFIIIASQI